MSDHCEILVEMIKQQSNSTKAIKLIQNTIEKSDKSYEAKTKMIENGIIECLIKQLVGCGDENILQLLNCIAENCQYAQQRMVSCGILQTLCELCTSTDSILIKSLSSLLLWNLSDEISDNDDINQIIKTITNIIDPLSSDDSLIINSLGALHSMTINPTPIKEDIVNKMVLVITSLKQSERVMLFVIRILTNLLAFQQFQTTTFNKINQFINTTTSRFLLDSLSLDITLSTSTQNPDEMTTTYKKKIVMIQAIENALTVLSQFVPINDEYITTFLTYSSVPFLTESLARLLVNVRIDIRRVEQFIINNLSTDDPKFLFLLYNIIHNNEPTTLSQDLRLELINTIDKFNDIQCRSMLLSIFSKFTFPEANQIIPKILKYTKEPWLSKHVIMAYSNLLLSTPAQQDDVVCFIDLSNDISLYNELTKLFMVLASQQNSKVFVKNGGIEATLGIIERSVDKEINKRCVGIIYLALGYNENTIEDKTIKKIIETAQNTQTYGILLPIVQYGHEIERLYKIAICLSEKVEIEQEKIGMYLLRGISRKKEWTKKIKKNEIGNMIIRVTKQSKNEHIVRICVCLMKDYDINEIELISQFIDIIKQWKNHQHLVKIFFKHIVRVQNYYQKQNVKIPDIVNDLLKMLDEGMREKMKLIQIGLQKTK
ncbi:hypothetical protein EHI8A_075740 [Entamoeba histolytica HM-1:IMSS-B]|uniref:Uncharacterized protein n=6 Tax=Entamoeba histolytica TaxID=5759 RepID=C4M3S7_ENTH1|nr:hypothetical protein EHI_052890 [Entamoeba histolytica HM-1:IMSS]EMD45461.1 Hypothetical protein EHI5A_111690 [Entamoeba histolytica KU27]EMH74039.1 hypothetical protein EHI8A_075740 [Entamoeba histolytica HM-1:IMSS-B]EMS17447.1 hypothetical protein KM1_135110 [Entamoeba histolytica HM-3:IMSS]ENY65020.1 hypothetical protein EHI7A_073170 [Entamoeba histolytica HM-1:IMSS-A]GAT95989.1 hypothetical protein CL6EHI_052890 [Entamoeba histolytica]|eukprot:XP_650461.1 hypothetical protein EHI_052890 [Entamoeba histolytica HM-1:IMSS]